MYLFIYYSDGQTKKEITDCCRRSFENGRKKIGIKTKKSQEGKLIFWDTGFSKLFILVEYSQHL